MEHATTIGAGVHSQRGNRVSAGRDVRFPQGPALANRVARSVGADDAAGVAVSDDAALAAIQFTKLAAELRRVVPMFPQQTRTRARTLATLRSVLRAQKRKCREGHWSYDYARHCGLIRLFDKMHAAAKRCEVA